MTFRTEAASYPYWTSRKVTLYKKDGSTSILLKEGSSSTLTKSYEVDMTEYVRVDFNLQRLTGASCAAAGYFYDIQFE